MQSDEFDAMRALSVQAFEDPSIGVLLDGLRGSWSWIDELSFVAERDGEIIAQVLYSHAILDAPDRLVEVLLLSPVGVRPDLQGQGIGSQLIRETLELVEARPEPLVFLEGSPAYYPRFGFVPAGELGFLKPSLRIPDAAFMVRPQPRADTDLSGQLVYPDVFWRTDSVGLR
jgi:putative acetyltransferase